MKKIQLYVDEIKDKEVYDLICELEKEGTFVNEENGKAEIRKGYVQDKLKERLRALKMLQDKVGHSDPFEVVFAYGKKNRNEDKVNEKPKDGDSKLDDIHAIGNQNF